MPRVNSESRSRPRGSVKSVSIAQESPFKSPVKIPLNDDVTEKAKRMQSRHALHDQQISKIKAAASPMRKLSNFERANSNSPSSNSHTPKNRRTRDVDMDEDLITVGGTAVTPMKRVPILANFEEWMKMATDNKINAANSWNFALIDYFHDMSLLKEGDGVNFQKASCTLDGCVKIYTSRVDSVATETGKLLSGLADSRENKKKGVAGEDDAADSEEEVEDEDGQVRKKPKKRTQRSSEATLAPSFATLQLKKMELEFSVDPLFKKASADFDEGGAKGLLLNHLAIDSHGRIVFDSSDDAGDASAGGQATKRKDDAVEESTEDAEPDNKNDLTEIAEEEEEDDEEIDIMALGNKFFPNLAILGSQDICPSLKNFDLGDPSGSLDIPFLKAPEDWRDERAKPEESAGAIGDASGIYLDDDAAGFDDDDGLLGGFDLAADVGFGEGGEAWAKDAAIVPQMQPHDMGFDNDGMADGEGEDGEIGNYDPAKSQFLVSMAHKKNGDHEDILSYFDQALQKNWAGPEHWRIKKIKDSSKPTEATKTRKEKEPFEIDFMSPLSPSLSQLIYTPASSSAIISLPKKDWKAKNRNLLPDDKHFNSKQLLRLFLKPKARLGSRRAAGHKSDNGPIPSTEDVPDGEMDEAFWARKENAVNPDDEALPKGDYDANFFQDNAGGGMDDDDEMPFTDALDHFSPDNENGALGMANMLGTQSSQGDPEGAFGTQLVTQSRRLRPEYVQYARVAKKVDVRRLKEELWKGLPIFDTPLPPKSNDPRSPGATPEPPTPVNKDESYKFTSVMQDLRKVYPKQAMNDISTSYCFICLLHLGNEKGLVIEQQENLQELVITRDFTAEITVGDG